MSSKRSDWNVSVIAWGEPSDPRSFSGYSHYLTRELKRQGAVRHEFSAKCISYSDMLRGAFTFKKNGRLLPKVVVSRAWMWSEAGQRRLSRRFADLLRQSGDRGPMLQVGTLVEVPKEVGPHYMLTDMTIPQADREGMFAVGQMSRDSIRHAIDVQRRVLHSSHHIFVLTEWCRQSMIEDFQLDPDKITVVYAGANLRIPEGVSEATEQRIDRETLFVGIDWIRKGGPLLIEAFRKVRAKLPDATLRIVGCNPHLHHEPGVIVEGYLDKRDPKQYEKLAKFYLRANCFCLPSQFDPFPNVIIEAASVGMPSVAVDNGSRREAVLDGVTGALAAEPTADSVAGAMIRVLENPAKCREMGEAARRHAADHFTWERVVAKIADVVRGTEKPAAVAAAAGA